MSNDEIVALLERQVADWQKHPRASVMWVDRLLVVQDTEQVQGRTKAVLGSRGLNK